MARLRARIRLCQPRFLDLLSYWIRLEIDKRGEAASFTFDVRIRAVKSPSGLVVVEATIGQEVLAHSFQRKKYSGRRSDGGCASKHHDILTSSVCGPILETCGPRYRSTTTCWRQLGASRARRTSPWARCSPGWRARASL